jgi:hypothetical protein
MQTKILKSLQFRALVNAVTGYYERFIFVFEMKESSLTNFLFLDQSRYNALNSHSTRNQT